MTNRQREMYKKTIFSHPKSNIEAEAAAMLLLCARLEIYSSILMYFFEKCFAGRGHYSWGRGPALMLLTWTRGKDLVTDTRHSEPKGLILCNFLYVQVKNFKTNVECSQFLPMVNGSRFVMSLKVGARAGN